MVIGVSGSFFRQRIRGECAHRVDPHRLLPLSSQKGHSEILGGDLPVVDRRCMERRIVRIADSPQGQ